MKLEHYLVTLKMNDDIIFARRKYFYDEALKLYNTIDDCIIRTLFYENSISAENVYILKLLRWDDSTFQYQVIKQNDCIF